MKISHIAFSVKDISLSKQFYIELFGLKFVSEFEKPEKHRKFVFLEDQTGTRLELSQDDNPQQLTEDLNNKKKIGIKHIAFAVDSIETSLEKAKKYNTKQITSIKNGVSVKRYIFITDPDNIPVELFEE